MNALRQHTGTIASVCLALGLFCFLAAAGYWLVVRDFDLTLRLILAAGILGVAGWVALRPEAPPRARVATRRQVLYGSNAAVMSLAVLAILGFVNYFGNQNPQRWDLTATGQNTLAPETIQVIEGIKGPLKITGFFQTEDFQRKQQLQDLMRSYQARQPLIQFEFVDPDQNPAAAQAAGIRVYGTLLYEYQGKTQTSTGSTEQDITSTILRLTATRTPKVLFLTGHGERSIDSTDRDGFSGVKQALQSGNYEVGSISFSTAVTPAAQLATSIDALVIAGPRVPFSPEDAAALNEYIDNGGRLLVLVDPVAGTNVTIEQVLERYGLRQRPDWVVDPANALRQDPAAFIAQRYDNTPVTEQLNTLGLVTIFPGVSALETLTTTTGLRQRSLVQTSNRAWLDPNPREPNPDGKPTGTFVLGYLVENNASAAPGGADTSRLPKGRAAFIGDVDFAGNQYVNSPQIANRDFFANLVGWVTESDEGITIRPKPFLSRTMFLSSTQQNFVFFSSALFLPLAVLLLGGVVWWRRR